MGRQGVIVSRGDDGGAHVLSNRCTHRGSAIRALNEGHATSFVHPYHGWQYETGGAPRSVQVPEGFGENWRAAMKRLSLRRVAPVAVYRGFIFATLAAEEQSPAEFLGHIASSLDNPVDRAPHGEVAGGVGRRVCHGNWRS